MFEPIGGSAPKYTGQNVICPLAAIGAVQMLVAELGEEQAADRIEQAIIKALGSGKIKSLNAGRMGMSTSEMGDLVAGLV
jgi:3-isopropylmalate dehydrogenase